MTLSRRLNSPKQDWLEVITCDLTFYMKWFIMTGQKIGLTCYLSTHDSRHTLVSFTILYFVKSNVRSIQRFFTINNCRTFAYFYSKLIHFCLICLLFHPAKFPWFHHSPNLRCINNNGKPDAIVFLDQFLQEKALGLATKMYFFLKSFKFLSWVSTTWTAH